MAANQLDERNLQGVAVGGQIREDVMNKIYDVSPEYTPFKMNIGRMTSKGSHLKEWVRESLRASSSTNKRIDGSSSAGINDTRTGERLANYHQISTATVRISDRARYIKGIEATDELVRQLMKRQKELRRDEEAGLTSRNEAIAGDAIAIASQQAGVGAWIGTGQSSTNSDRGVGGADPILSGNPGGFPATAAVSGTKRALTETRVKAMMREAYIKGGQPTMMMSTPSAIEKVSDYLLTAQAKVATLQSWVPQGQKKNLSGDKYSMAGVVAQGAVTTFVTTWGTLMLTPNRFQPEVAAAVADVYLLDLDYWEVSYLQGYETKFLARDGLGENREISVDYALCSLAEEASAVVADIDTDLAMTDV